MCRESPTESQPDATPHESLGDLRARIDALDDQIAQLLQERADALAASRPDQERRRIGADLRAASRSRSAGARAVGARARSTSRRWRASIARSCPRRARCSGRRGWRTWDRWPPSATRRRSSSSAARPSSSRARRTPRCSRWSKKAPPTTAWSRSRTRPKGPSTRCWTGWSIRRCRSAPRSACRSRTRCCRGRRRWARSSACCAIRRRPARRGCGWPSTCPGVAVLPVDQQRQGGRAGGAGHDRHGGGDRARASRARCTG